MPTDASNPISQFIPFILIFAIFYFLIIRPQQKKQKDQKNMINSLKKNDKIVTAGGIHGTVVLVKEKTIVVRVDDSAKIELDRESITSLIKG